MLHSFIFRVIGNLLGEGISKSSSGVTVTVRNFNNIGAKVQRAKDQQGIELFKKSFTL